MSIGIMRNGRTKFEGVALPLGWRVEKNEHHADRIHVIKVVEGETSVATISWKERTVDTGWTPRFRKYREEVPAGRGWRTKLVEQAVAALGYS